MYFNDYKHEISTIKTINTPLNNLSSKFHYRSSNIVIANFGSITFYCQITPKYFHIKMHYSIIASFHFGLVDNLPIVSVFHIQPISEGLI